MVMTVVMITILKLLGVLVLGLLFGLERQKSHKNVSFGTFVFIALGSCGLGILVVSSSLPNATAILGAIVTGIGFLGAGALIKGTEKVYGFTTAAAMWLFAIIGLTAGIGEYLISGSLYATAWLVIGMDKYLETKGMGSYQRKLVITSKLGLHEKEVQKYLNAYTSKAKILSVQVDKNNKEAKLTYLVEGSREELNVMIQNMVKEEWLKVCSVE